MVHNTLHQLLKFGTGVGLHRMQWLCADSLNSTWAHSLDALKVTGSNGKGSVCAMVSAILGALEVRVGTYTSPHLFRFNERIVLNGQPIDDDLLSDYSHWLETQLISYANIFPDDTIGAFEAFTALAFQYYADQQPDTLVVEAGIGGRYDSTRFIPGRWVGLTSLDLEHTKLLGPTLELIAYDKADLCPVGGTLVVGEIDSEVLRRLRAYCDVRGVTLDAVADHSRIERVEFTSQGMVVDLVANGWQLPGLTISLSGQHQAKNSLVAIQLVRHWLNAHRPELAEAMIKQAIYDGLAHVRWTGRLEQVSTAPDIYLDVGHSPAAVNAAVATLRQMVSQPILLVLGISHDKAQAAISQPLLSCATRVICTQARERPTPAAQLGEIVRSLRPDLPTTVIPDLAEAVATARAQAEQDGLTVFIAGGLFLAIEAHHILAGGDPEILRFF